MAGWLLFFSSLPSKPVGNRVKVWRKLSKSGAVQLRGSAYVLPDGDAQREFFQWLAAEVSAMGGEAAYVGVERVETVPDGEIVALFDRRKAADYGALAVAVDAVERRLASARQGTTAAGGKRLAGDVEKIRRDFTEARRTDFFGSAAGDELERRITEVEAALQSLAEPAAGPTPVIRARRVEDYRGRRWVTRGRPFVDRMASAWLIRRFIDPGATFDFIAADDAATAVSGAAVFDVVGGEFTHAGDLCTFEVLVRSFAFGDAALAEVAEIVHDLDARDDRYRRAEARGVEGILVGIQRTARDDNEALERGIAVFEALYAAKGR